MGMFFRGDPALKVHYHEAGHAVLGKHFGWKNVRAEVWGPEEGYTFWDDESEVEDFDLAVMAYAGQMAEQKYTGRPSLGAAMDDKQAAEACRRAGVSKYEARAAARSLVNQNWSSIKKTAGRL